MECIVGVFFSPLDPVQSSNVEEILLLYWLVSSLHKHLKLLSDAALDPQEVSSHSPVFPIRIQPCPGLHSCPVLFPVWKGPRRFPRSYCFTPCPVSSLAPLNKHRARPALFLCPLLRYLPPAMATWPKQQYDSAAHSAGESFTSLSSDFASALGQEVYLF